MSQKPPFLLRPGVLLRGFGLFGFCVGFLIGVNRMISKGMDCAAYLDCENGQPDPSIWNLLVPMGLGLLGGLMLGGLVLFLVLRQVGVSSGTESAAVEEARRELDLAERIRRASERAAMEREDAG
jgi:hypothetical protein